MNRGDFLQTASGLAFHPLDPQQDEICIEDIAFTLSQQCRFAGACSPWYSVADHSLRVSELVPPADALWGLLHDASEAYLVDVPRPIKPMLVGYREIEAKVMAAICVKFGLPTVQPASIHVADNVMLATEARDLMKRPPMPWPTERADVTYRPLDTRITPRSPEQARVAFLNRFEKLSRFAR